MQPSQYRHLFFDLDKTLTASRSLMLPEHQVLFKTLGEKKDIVVVTGGMESQIQSQIPDELRVFYFMLSQQGNHAEDKEGKLLWEERVSPEQERVAREVHQIFKMDVGLTVLDDTEYFENRGSMIATSYIGFHADYNVKYAYDPDASKRLALIARHPTEIAKLRSVGLEVMPAGTTTLDFILQGKDKGHNVARLIADRGWNKADCVYVGDALFPGGNDESVIGIIETKPVKDPAETFSFIQSVLNS